MTVKVADAHAHVHRLVLLVKMVTMLKECTTEERRSVVRLLWVKGLSVKDIHKEMFPVCGGKCLSRKAVQPCGKRFADEEVETEKRK
jgi:hypothetical protein